MKVQSYLNRPSPFLRRLLGRDIEPDAVDESHLPEGILMVLADNPKQALAAALRCRPLIYDQVAAIIGVSRDRARQLEIRAAANLRVAHRFRQLCRFLPGWQNALRLPPDDAMSLLPGEAMPPEFMKGRPTSRSGKVSGRGQFGNGKEPGYVRAQRSNGKGLLDEGVHRSARR